MRPTSERKDAYAGLYIKSYNASSVYVVCDSVGAERVGRSIMQY